MRKIFMILTLFFSASILKASPTTWWPDTCPGSEYIYDIQDETVIFSSVVIPCQYYQDKGIIDKAQFNAVLLENQQKNFLYGAIQENSPELTVDKSTVSLLLNFNYSFDKNRNLIVDVPGLTAQKLSDATTAAAAKLQEVQLKQKLTP